MMFLSKLKPQSKSYMLLSRRNFFQNLKIQRPRFIKYQTTSEGSPSFGSPTVRNGTKGEQIYHTKDMMGIFYKKVPTFVGSITATAFLMALWPLWLSDTLLWWKGSPSTAAVQTNMFGKHADMVRPITYAHLDKHTEVD